MSLAEPALAAAPLVRLLIVNPNSNTAVTALAAQSASLVLGPDTEATVIGSAQASVSIETLDQRHKAEPLAIDLLANNPGYDAYVMACFDDIGVMAGRRFLGRPIVGSAEAALAIARCFAPRVAIITTVETMVPGIRALLRDLGAEDWCSVHAAGIGVAEAADGGASVEAKIDAAIVLARNTYGAGAIVLGSGGLAGRSKELSQKHKIPVIDSIAAAAGMAELAAKLTK